MAVILLAHCLRYENPSFMQEELKMWQGVYPHAAEQRLVKELYSSVHIHHCIFCINPTHSLVVLLRQQHAPDTINQFVII